ncbi:uncharacterized protein PHACADRAFT_257882 [Phanerochaete carnosa HHB-10118-sp]|uniref:peptidyl-tRNA hydrolase n=1 Tax=Phanerochaete carnosa (strain HHB-10118-sp) TaxID=650164 RepID=K5W5H1_PHACS|nr:uncharacterized protein PHACADRAFT_257882 [Phanerochaete carnosa HHB-10118-sp]EKM54204.1 hypothetical protein PHACADRAFT_257882 [Phanerochaete carnosa HHB-10118-sp]
MSKLLVVGLGNFPYPLTRHSVGHLVVQSLADRVGISISADKRLDGLVGRGSVTLAENDVSLTLYLPKALMNITGRPTVNAMKSLGFQPSSMVVIHDSLSHRPGVASPKSGGSAEGHNGVRSVMAALGGSKDFHRLRIGIGRGDGNVADYVLGRLSSYEKQYWGTDGDGIDVVLRELAKIANGQPRPG